MKSLLFVSLVAVGFNALASGNTSTFSTKGLTTLAVKNQAGNIRITKSKDKKAYVTSQKISFSSAECKLTQAVEGHKLVVKVKSDGLFDGEECKVNFNIRVPRTLALEVANGSGNIDILGMKGSIDYKVGSGTVNINGSVTDLAGKSGKGDVTIKGLRGSANIKSGVSNLKLTYSSVPQNGKLNIKVGKGNAEVFMPRKSKLNTNFKVGVGDLNSEFGTSSSAGYEVNMKAGVGNLTLKKIR